MLKCDCISFWCVFYCLPQELTHKKQRRENNGNCLMWLTKSNYLWNTLWWKWDRHCCPLDDFGWNLYQSDFWHQVFYQSTWGCYVVVNLNFNQTCMKQIYGPIRWWLEQPTSKTEQKFFFFIIWLLTASS